MFSNKCYVIDGACAVCSAQPLTRKRKGDVSALKRVICDYFNGAREERDRNTGLRKSP